MAMLSALLCLLAAGAVNGRDPIAQAFEAFTIAFARNYSGAEREQRFAIFERNVALIEVGI